MESIEEFPRESLEKVLTKFSVLFLQKSLEIVLNESLDEIWKNHNDIPDEIQKKKQLLNIFLEEPLEELLKESLMNFQIQFFSDFFEN